MENGDSKCSRKSTPYSRYLSSAAENETTNNKTAATPTKSQSIPQPNNQNYKKYDNNQKTAAQSKTSTERKYHE
jgi:hypothetical protein